MASVELNWTDNSSDETGFPIYRSTTSSPSFPADYTKIHTAAADATTWTDTSAPDGTTVYYAVTAENGDGESAETSGSITTTSVPTNQSAALDVGTASVSGLSPNASTPTPATGDVTRGLVSKWKFDNDLLDSVGSNDATGSVSYAPGVIDQAVQFNGSNASSAADDPTMDTPEFSVGFHAYPVATSTGTSDIHCYVNKDNDYNDRMFWIVQWDGIWQARVGSNAATVQGPAVVPNEWVHVMLTYDGSTFTLYIDGTSVGSNTENTLDGDSANLMFGAEDLGNRHVPNGTLIDEGRFHNVCLDANEVADVAAYDGTTTATPQSMTASVAEVGVLGLSNSFSAGPVSASANSGSVAASTAAPSASPGPTAASFGSASVSASSLALSAVGGPVAAGTEVATASLFASDAGLGLGVASVGLNSGSLATSALSGAVTPGGTGVTTSTGVVTAASPASTVTPGPTGASVEPGVLTSAPFSPSLFQSGSVIRVAASEIGLSGVGPTAVGGPTSMSSETAVLDSTAAFPFVEPHPTQVTGNVATAALSALDSIVKPGVVSAATETGSVSVLGASPAAVGGSTAFSPTIGGVEVVSVAPEWELDGLIRLELKAAGVAVFSHAGSFSAGSTEFSADSAPIWASGPGFSLAAGTTALTVDSAASTVSATGPILSTNQIETVLQLLGVVDYEHRLEAAIADDPSLVGRADVVEIINAVLKQ